VVVGSWPCRVSSEVHINGCCISDPVREDKGKVVATGQEDEKDSKGAHVMLSQGQVLLQWRQTRAGAQITLIGFPELEIGMDDRVFLTGLSGLTAGICSGWIIQDVLVGLVTRSKNREAQAGLQTRNITRLTRKTGLPKTWGGGQKTERRKGVAPNRKLESWWCPRGITKTQRHKLQKMHQKELVEKEEQQDYWFNYLWPMT
jgi:hypothetical protein